MTSQPRIFWIGLTIYTASFFVPAVGGEAIHSGPALGYHCAFYSLLAVTEILRMIQGSATLMGPIGTLSWVASGLINVLFVASTLMSLVRRLTRTTQIVWSCLIVALFPFCWVVFREMKLYPLAGYFFWTIGMAVVLVSTKSPNSENAKRLIVSR
jgi:hypothetical protein